MYKNLHNHCLYHKIIGIRITKAIPSNAKIAVPKNNGKSFKLPTKRLSIGFGISWNEYQNTTPIPIAIHAFAIPENGAKYLRFVISDVSNIGNRIHNICICTSSS